MSPEHIKSKEFRGREPQMKSINLIKLGLALGLALLLTLLALQSDERRGRQEDRYEPGPGDKPPSKVLPRNMSTAH